MTDFAAARRTMVENQLRTFDVNDQVLLAAFERVPREVFVDPRDADFAYLDRDALARDGKTRLLAPMVLARMIQALDLARGEKVLDVGGAGYGAAILKAMDLQAIALEASPEDARASLALANASDVPVLAGSYAEGVSAHAPFDAIVVHGAAEIEPTGLLKQLKEDGALVIVMGRGRAARATVFKRVGDTFSGARAFDAAAPLLEEFAKKPEFSI